MYSHSKLLSDVLLHILQNEKIGPKIAAKINRVAAALIMLQYILHYRIAFNFRLLYYTLAKVIGDVGLKCKKSGAPGRRNIYLTMFRQYNSIVHRMQRNLILNTLS